MSKKKTQKKKGIIKAIWKDHFAGFWEFHADVFPKELQGDIQETVLKAIRCGTKNMGNARFECLGCSKGNTEPVMICFTCKSRFCHGCGKKYTDEWTEKQVERILNIPHRHTVFTIPEELRTIFFEDRKKLNELSNEVAQVFSYWYGKKNKSRELEVGVITVIHTFGRDLKFNPHIHALVTEGAIDKNKEWVSVEYIPYEYLRKSWQKVLMDLVKKWFPEDAKMKKLISDLYTRYPSGFYVNAEQRMKDARGAARYIGRYLARPAIAEYRIVSYDGKEVHFWHEDHKTKKRVDQVVAVYRFIYLILQHIPPKHFRMVSRYGLYCRQKNKESQKISNIWNFNRTKQIEMLLEWKKQKKTYRQRMIAAFDQDPIQCPCCGETMELVVIWHPDYGRLYYYAEDLERKRDERWGISAYERRKEKQREKQRVG